MADNNLTWDHLISALKANGYEGATEKGTKAMEDIAAFVGPDGSIAMADGRELSKEAIAALAELTPQGEADQLPVTINLGEGLAPVEDEAPMEEPEPDEMLMDAPMDEEDEEEDEVLSKSLDIEVIRKAVRDELAEGKAVAVTQSKGRLAMPSTKITAPMRGQVKNLRKLAHYTEAERREKAFGMGQYFLATIFGKDNARKWCQDQGIQIKAQTEGTNTAGGYLVPEEFSTDIIDLRDEYGVFRQNSRVHSMASDHVVIPRRTGGLTAYAVGESDSITESNATWDQVSLTAKKWATLTRYTSEVDEDAAISIGDWLAGEIAYAFANKEDDCGFNGDGTSTYHGVYGIRQIVGSAGIYTGGGGATGNETWNSLTLADHHNTMGLLPQYCYTRSTPKWYCSRAYFATVMQRLAYAGGGNTVDLIQGGDGMSFLGYPVVLSEVWPTATAVSTNSCGFGSLELATTMGDRRGVTIATSSDRYFDSDEIAIRGTTRWDINCHDLGDSSNAGAFVILRTADS